MDKMAMSPRWRNGQDLYKQVQTQLVTSHEFMKDLGILKKK